MLAALSGLPWVKVLGIALLLAGICCIMIGCANSGTALYQATVTARAGVQMTSPLVASGTIPVAIGTDISIAGYAVHGSLIGWNAVRKSTDPAVVRAAATLAARDLTTLEEKLAALASKNKGSKLAGKAAALQLKIANVRQIVETDPGIRTRTKAVPINVIIAIAQIVLTELPTALNWINSAFQQNAPSDAQIQTELDGFLSDLGTLDQVLATKGG